VFLELCLSMHPQHRHGRSDVPGFPYLVLRQLGPFVLAFPPATGDRSTLPAISNPCQ
jgi:hypothetical protein